MSEALVVELAQEALTTVLILSAPMLGVGLLVGLIVSIFQATTQIQEATLAFIPKIVAIFASLVIFGPWMISVIINYTTELFSKLYLYMQ